MDEDGKVSRSDLCHIFNLVGGASWTSGECDQVIDKLIKQAGGMAGAGWDRSEFDAIMEKSGVEGFLQFNIDDLAEED